jgi:hypothetical protein
VDIKANENGIKYFPLKLDLPASSCIVLQLITVEALIFP